MRLWMLLSILMTLLLSAAFYTPYFEPQCVISKEKRFKALLIRRNPYTIEYQNGDILTGANPNDWEPCENETNPIR